MGFFSVVLAAMANFAFGAVWYMTLAKPWMAASGVALDEDGQPANRSDPLPYITSFIAAVLVAGMMRHIFALGGIDSFGKGAISGFGIGLFLVTPWIWRQDACIDYDRWQIRNIWMHRNWRRADVILKMKGSSNIP